MADSSCVKVIFTAKVKSEIPGTMLAAVRDAARAIDGFIDMESSTEGEIETTVSWWRSSEAVRAWARNPVHGEAKRNKSVYYDWYDVAIEEGQAFPPVA